MCFKKFLKIAFVKNTSSRLALYFHLTIVYKKKLLEAHIFDVLARQIRNFQKQPPEMFYKNTCSQKFHNIHKKTPVLESLFNKVGGL